MPFSIIIPCRDRVEDLRNAIRSCLSQTHGDFELLIVDDCSTEDIASLCASFSDARIRYFRNEVNLGVSRSRNLGIANAGGSHLLFLDSDDTYLPDKLARVSAEIASHPDVAVCFHSQYRILPNGSRQVIPPRAPRPGESLDNFILLNGNHVQTNSYVVRADIARAVRFDEKSSLFEDTRFIIECALAAGGYRHIDAVLSVYDDRNAHARLSKRIDRRTMASFLDFVRKRCSREAAAGVDALMCGHTSFWTNPAGVMTGLWRGHRSGVSTVRTLVYFMRSALGASNANRIIALVQK